MALEQRAGSPPAEAPGGAATLFQEALDRLDVPALVLTLPSRRIVAANPAIAALLGLSAAEAIGMRNDEMVDFEMPEDAIQAVDALSAGAIDAYRARRRFLSRDGVSREVMAWTRLIEFCEERYAAFLVSSIAPPGDGPQVTPPPGWAGLLVVGRATRGWRITCVSTDIQDLLGGDTEDYLRTTLLDLVHPDDATRLLDAVPAARDDRGVVTMRQLRLHHRDGRWVAVQCLLVFFDRADPPDLGFVLLPAPPQESAADRVAEMELRMRRIAAELRAAGMMDGIDTLPTADEFPQISTLSSRQWHILVRLLRGERVPGIARELHVSPSTLRNHLSQIFVRFGVHSQAELIALLRRR